MTPEQLKAKFPHASPAFIKANAGRVASGAKPEHSTGNASHADRPSQTRHPRKCLVRITCYRVRPQDPDNGVYKFHVDAIRHAGLLDDDTADALDLQVVQVKVQSRAYERTEIEITRL